MKKPYADEAPMRRVGPLLILLVAAVAVVLTTVGGLMHLWGVADTPENAPTNQLRGRSPALETAPQPALEAYLAEKQSISETYAWMDPPQHLARIPVEAAMQALTAPSEVPPDRRAAWMMDAEGTKAAPPPQRDVTPHSKDAP